MNTPITAVREIVSRKVTDLVPHPRNPRKHPHAQITQIAASIKERGFNSPIQIDTQNTIIAGVGRWHGAIEAGMLVVPCIVLKGLTEAQKAAYVIADNKLALNAEWDEEMLVAELGRLAELEYDLDLTGFIASEMATLAEAVDADLRDVTDDIHPAQREADQPAASEPSADQSSVDHVCKPQPIVKPGGGDHPPSRQAALPAPETGKPAAVQTGDRHRETQDAWKGMPEFNQPAAGPFRTIYVHFKDQAAVDAFTKLIDQNITDKTKFVWYPEAEKAKAAVVYG